MSLDISILNELVNEGKYFEALEHIASASEDEREWLWSWMRKHKIDPRKYVESLAALAVAEEKKPINDVAALLKKIGYGDLVPNVAYYYVASSYNHALETLSVSDLSEAWSKYQEVENLLKQEDRESLKSMFHDLVLWIAKQKGLDVVDELAKLGIASEKDIRLAALFHNKHIEELNNALQQGDYDKALQIVNAMLKNKEDQRYLEEYLKLSGFEGSIDDFRKSLVYHSIIVESDISSIANKANNLLSLYPSMRDAIIAAILKKVEDLSIEQEKKLAKLLNKDLAKYVYAHMLNRVKEVDRKTLEDLIDVGEYIGIDVSDLELALKASEKDIAGIISDALSKYGENIASQVAEALRSGDIAKARKIVEENKLGSIVIPGKYGSVELSKLINALDIWYSKIKPKLEEINKLVSEDGSVNARKIFESEQVADKIISLARDVLGDISINGEVLDALQTLGILSIDALREAVEKLLGTAYLAKAYKMLREGKYKEADKYLDKALSMLPQDIDKKMIRSLFSAIEYVYQHGLTEQDIECLARVLLGEIPSWTPGSFVGGGRFWVR